MRSIARIACCLVVLAFGVAASEMDRQADQPGVTEGEFHMARLKYPTLGGGGSRGYFQPYWAIDYPLAEAHFLAALRRLTRLSTASDSIHLELGDARIFNYPFLFLQQPAKGGWSPKPQEAANLREYLLRGGFLLVDDFHGEYEWNYFQMAMRKVFPDRPIVDIPPDDPLMTIIFATDQHTSLPGRRHLWVSGGQTQVHMEGPPHWRAIYDDNGRAMVAINHNSDMGDAWEHEDDPVYPLPMTAMAYKIGANYVIYSMTH